MQPSTTLRAVHKPLIRFIGPRALLWKDCLELTHCRFVIDAPHHSGPHPLTPTNLEKHVAKAEPVKPPTPAASSRANTSSIEYTQLAAKYRRAPISETEMEAIESGGATYII
ncbi:hypothetical protein BDF20DRAFT_906966 [Mycotypha africana]|uniref:uncharacterized protein n=1 Tax=Mycotypha africana TaxID=64632 RepID=UPI0023005D94|nr:uncharacterized protein BDF20DRAFT_906966 [Mycotypha africana]KAI8973307.1 hypothetical protein BDF20DRAFT_906966 [Mycotypha africana]